MNTKTVAIVTGTSQGIGQATALRLARDFCAVVLVARSKEEIADLLGYLVSPAAKWMTGSSVRMDGCEIKGI